MNRKTEEETKKDIIDQMYWDPEVDATHVNVDLSAGAIILTGRVQSYSARQSAWKDAWLVSNGYDIDNRLTIEYPEEIRILSDERLLEFVKSALFFNPAIDSSKLDVTVRDRTVRVSGVVDSYWHKEKITDIISGIKGVFDIRNEVAVVIPEKIPDEKIVADIFYAFLRSVGMDTDMVRVKVDEGRVRLEGSVPDKITCDVVGKIAALTNGVTGLENDLEVR